MPLESARYRTPGAVPSFCAHTSEPSRETANGEHEASTSVKRWNLPRGTSTLAIGKETPSRYDTRMERLSGDQENARTLRSRRAVTLVGSPPPVLGTTKTDDISNFLRTR